MSFRDQGQDHVESSTSVTGSRRSRKERPVTYQLDLSQRRNSDELSTVKTPPRPQLQRNPRSSPVVPTNRYIQTQGRSEPYAGSAADGTPSPQRLLPRLSFGRDISFNKDELSSLFDHESPGKYARTYTRLRRSSKMSNNQNLRAESRRQGVSLTRLITTIAVISNRPTRASGRRSSLEVTIDNLLTGRKREYTVDDKIHEVRHLECVLEEVLSGHFLHNDQSSAPHIDGVLYIYDITNNEILLSLPGFLDVLKQAELPVLIVPSTENGSTHESRAIMAGVDEQCDLMHDEMTVFHTAMMHGIRKTGYIPFLLQHIAEKPRDVYDDSSDSDPFMSDGGSANPLGPHRSRNDSKVSSRSHLKNKRSSQHSSFAGTHRSISENGYDDTLDENPARQPSQSAESQSATLASLASRILKTPTNDVDEKFTAIFFCVYKFFASPAETLETLLDGSSNDPSTRTTALDDKSSARLIAILHFWVLTYPGDFAEGPAVEILRSFLSNFGSTDAFGPRRQQIAKALDLIQRNDDTFWGRYDGNDYAKARASSAPLTNERQKSLPTASPTISLSESFDKTLRLKSEGSPSSNPSQEAEPIKRRSTNRTSRSKFSISLQQRPSPPPPPAPSSPKIIPPSPPMTKTHWRLFMEIPETVLAETIASLDRRLFLSPTPRDFLRHVTTSASKRQLYPSLAHISALTAHFNHLASWAATLILLRDKPRDRALTLEKVMRLARRVRELNDYHALGALVAGIHNTAVHRLAQTRELLSKETAKDFARLEILMGTARGHAAYRLAWENTTQQGRVPYVPVLLSDLVTADASGATFAAPAAPAQDGVAQGVLTVPTTPVTPTSPVSLNRDGGPGSTLRASRQINWHKFERMGEVLYLIETTQAAIPRHLAADVGLDEDARALLLDVGVLDDDGLYARSCAVEPGSAGSAGAGAPGGAGGGDGKGRKSFMDRLLAGPLVSTNDGPGLGAMYLRG